MNNKPSFAFGRLAAEFAVIVVGVLVALAADRWRDSSGDSARRDQYMLNLIADVQADTQTFRRTQRTGIAASSRRVLAAARGKAVPHDSVSLFLFSIESLQWYNPPVVTRETYDDLVATGNLNLLKPQLRRVLAQYYNRVQYTERRETLFRDILVAGYRHAPSRILGPELHPEVFRRIQAQRDERKPDVPVLWKIEDVQIDDVLRRLRGIPELEPWIAERVYVDQQQAEIYGDRLYRQASDLLRMLNGVKAGTLKAGELRFSADALRS